MVNGLVVQTVDLHVLSLKMVVQVGHLPVVSLKMPA